MQVLMVSDRACRRTKLRAMTHGMINDVSGRGVVPAAQSATAAPGGFQSCVRRASISWGNIDQPMHNPKPVYRLGTAVISMELLVANVDVVCTLRAVPVACRPVKFAGRSRVCCRAYLWHGRFVVIETSGLYTCQSPAVACMVAIKGCTELVPRSTA